VWANDVRGARLQDDIDHQAQRAHYRLPEMQAATPEQVAAIASEVEPRWQALILIAAYSGLRWGELAGLR